MGRRRGASARSRTSASRSPPRRTRSRRCSASLLTPFGDAGQTIWVVIAFLALGALAWLTYELGAHWFGPAAGVVAGLVILTRIPVLSFGVRAYVDIPYVALVLGAILAEARRPQTRGCRSSCSRSPACSARGVAVLARLRRLASATSSCCRSPLAAPVLWMLHDLVLAGDPLHSLTGTRDNAEVLQRKTGLDDVPLTVPRRLGEILREPGPARRGRRRDPRAGVHAPAGRAADRGRLRLDRRVLRARRRRPADPRPLPAAARRAARRLLRRRRVRLAAARARRPLAHALGGDRRASCSPSSSSSPPARSNRIARPARARWARSRRSSPTCTRSATSFRCRPVAVPNHRPVPHVALWTGIPPERDRLGAARAARPRGVYIDPASERVRRNFTLDPHDPKTPHGDGPARLRASRPRTAHGCSTRAAGQLARVAPAKPAASAKKWTVHPLSKSASGDCPPH